MEKMVAGSLAELAKLAHRLGLDNQPLPAAAIHRSSQRAEL
jgi:hypothetical protein